MGLRGFRGVYGVCEFVLDLERGKPFWKLTAYMGNGRNRRYPRLELLLKRETLRKQLVGRGITVERIDFNDGQCWVYPAESPLYAGRTTDAVVAALAQNYPRYRDLPMRWSAWNGETI